MVFYTELKSMAKILFLLINSQNKMIHQLNHHKL